MLQYLMQQIKVVIDHLQFAKLFIKLCFTIFFPLIVVSQRHVLGSRRLAVYGKCCRTPVAAFIEMH